MPPYYGCVSRRLACRTRVFRQERRCGLFALIVAGLAGLVCDVNAQLPKPEEYHVKAVYLYNFGKFVQWPASENKSESFTICVLGRDPFGPALDTTLAGESIDNRKLLAKRIANSRDAAGCQILFISASESARLKEILATVEKFRVLTVSDIPGFTANGGMIQFVLMDNKVRFEVNVSATEKAGLTCSSQLLKVASDIRKSPGNGPKQ